MRLANAMRLGQRLRRERQRLNWSQERLAEAIGATAMSIHRWEHDQSMPQARYRERLCLVFNTGAEALFAASASEGGQAHAHPLIWSVPYRRNPFFTGREAVLERLHQALRSKAVATLTQAQAISGLGGIGKTQVALEYAHRFRENYQAVLWARADTCQGLLADFAAIAALLQLPADDGDQQRCVEAVKGWLNEQTDWLLILDNVEDLGLLDEVLPSVGQGHLLLTTRTQATGTLAQGIELEQMEPTEGALFLLRRAKRLAPDALLEDAPDALRSQALQIAEVLDGLPLALDQAGAYLEETACDLLAYLDHYQARRACLLARRGERVTEHPESVSTTFSLAIEQVEQANPAAAELLRLCAFLHPDAIPEELLAEGADELGPILQSTVLDSLALDGAIKDLRRFSLLRRMPDSKTLTIHRLVQAVIKDGMDENTQRQWAERTVRVVNRAFPDGGTLAAWSTCQRCLPHAHVCAALIEQWDLACAEAARLLHRTGTYLCARAHYTQAKPLLQSALTLGEQALGPEQTLVAEILNDLAVLYCTQGNYAQAEPLYQRALLIYERTLGPEHPDLAHCLNNLAFLYYTQGNYVQAEPLYQRALLIREQTLGPEHLMVAESVHNLAALYRDQGKYIQAEPLFQRALLIYEQALGPEHPSFAHSLNALARLYYSQGNYAQAEPLFQRALLIREQTLGPEHPRVALCLNYLADLYSAQGQHAQAEPLSQRALAIRLHSLNPEHPDVAQCLNTLAKLAHAQGQYDRAHALFQQALGIREKSLGPEHPAVAETLTALGRLYYTQGEYRQADPLYQRALNIREKSLGAEHPEVAETLAALGQLDVAQQKHVEAATLFQRALAIWERCLDPAHPSVIACVESYAALLGTRERTDQASA